MRGTGLSLSVAVMALTLCSARAAAAEGWRMDLGAGVTAMVYDDALADFRWDVRPHSALTAHALALHGRWEGGLILRTTSTSQASGLASAPTSPQVSLNSVELRAAYRILQWQSVQLWAQVQGGKLMMRYSPQRLLLSPPDGSDPVEVDFAPIDEWTGGFSAALRREFFGTMALSAQLGYWTFALDTSHRRGTEIVRQRRGFSNWGLGLSASWLLDL